MPIPCRAPATMATAMVLLLLQTGCTGTPLGDGLSRSFPSPGSVDQPSSQQEAAGPASQANPAPTMTGPMPKPVGLTPPGGQLPASGPAAPAQQASPASGATKTAAGPPPPTAAGTPAMAPGAPRVRKSAPAANPLPYRVTIRLPEADPSAPAEAVTKALRATGVAFEVETIERITTPGSAPLATPPPSPASAAESAAPAPTTRPAPPPR
jgi:hypothetical protein